jgi:hypothetical protein
MASRIGKHRNAAGAIVGAVQNHSRSSERLAISQLHDHSGNAAFFFFWNRGSVGGLRRGGKWNQKN